MSEIDAYLKKATLAQKAEYQRIRKIVRGLVPDIEEVISYGIPTFKYKGKYVIYWGAFPSHMSIFPGSRIEGLKDKLKGFKLGKGTIQYSEDNLIPETIIKELVMTRYEELQP